MGICSAKPVESSGAGVPKDAEPAPAKAETFSQEQIKALHSKIRWEKPLEEIKACVISPGIVNSSDDQNGNTAIHIAAQNGHLTVVEFIISAGADVNIANKTGATALHMSQEYGFFWVSKALRDAGADGEIKNSGGFAAKSGIEGTVDGQDWVSAIQSAKTKEQIYEGIRLCTENKSSIAKSKFAMGYLTYKRNKENKHLWENGMSQACAKLAKSDGWKTE